MKSLIHLLCILSAAGFTLSLPITERDLARQQDLFQRNQRNGGMYKREPVPITERDLARERDLFERNQRNGGMYKREPVPITKRDLARERDLFERNQRNGGMYKREPVPVTKRDQDLFERNQRNGGMYKREPAHILYEAIEERDLGGGAGIQPQQQQEGESRSGNLPGAITKREAEAGVEERAPENLFGNVS